MSAIVLWETCLVTERFQHLPSLVVLLITYPLTPRLWTALPPGVGLPALMLCRFSAPESMMLCRFSPPADMLGGLAFAGRPVALPLWDPFCFGGGCSSTIATEGLTNMP